VQDIPFTIIVFRLDGMERMLGGYYPFRLLSVDDIAACGIAFADTLGRMTTTQRLDLVGIDPAVSSITIAPMILACRQLQRLTVVFNNDDAMDQMAALKTSLESHPAIQILYLFSLAASVPLTTFRGTHHPKTLAVHASWKLRRTASHQQSR
jgi:hypothetical protein